MEDSAIAEMVARYAVIEPRSREGLDTVLGLAAALDGEPEFSSPRMIVNGSGAHAWTPQFAAQIMLSMVRGGRAPTDAVALIRKAPTITEGAGGAVKLLYGIQCEQKIAITDDIALLPFADIPKSSLFNWILDEHERANESPLVHGYTAGPSAALFRKGVVAPIFRDGNSDWQDEPPAAWFRDLDVAARLLALVPKSLPQEAAHWFHYDDPDIARIGQFGLTRQGSELQPMMFTAPATVTAESVTGVFISYQQLKKHDKDRVDLALDRMIRARRQLLSGNKAIDLAISLEVLFMNTERDEHSYKISLRASRLLRADANSRKRTFMEVRRLYDMRSSMVHSGHAKNEYLVDDVKVSAHDLVETADRVCTEAILEFFRLGAIPSDWRSIELA